MTVQWIGWLTAILIWINLLMQLYTHYINHKWRNAIHKENLELHLRIIRLERIVSITPSQNNH